MTEIKSALGLHSYANSLSKLKYNNHSSLRPSIIVHLKRIILEVVQPLIMDNFKEGFSHPIISFSPYLGVLPYIDSPTIANILGSPFSHQGKSTNQVFPHNRALLWILPLYSKPILKWDTFQIFVFHSLALNTIIEYKPLEGVRSYWQARVMYVL